MMNLKLWKDETRKKLSAIRDGFSVEERKRRDSMICDRVTSLVSYRHSKIILLYYPIKSEINVLKIAECALKDGKEVAFPVCDKENRDMKYVFVKSLSDFRTGSYGIPEPVGEEVYSLGDSRPALCVVPGLAFDKKGYRLGYGGGYYDRFLPKFVGCRVAPIYSELFLDEIPRGQYDESVDVVITERSVNIIDRKK